ncbi:alginate lyase family protein [soil metagenome]
MKKITLLLLLLSILLASKYSLGQKYNNAPNVFSLDAKTLAANQQLISSSDEILMPAYKSLLKEADKALEFGPVSVMEKKNFPPSGNKHDYMSLAPYHWPDPTKANGLPYIRKDGQTNPEVKEYKDKEYMPQLCDKVYKLSLAYYFSGNKKYAEHATDLLRVWFLDTATRMNPNLNYGQAIKGVNTGRGAGMIDARHFIKVMDAVGLLNGSAALTEKDHTGMKSWFADFLTWMQSSKNGIHEKNAPNNHGAWYDALRLSISLFVDNKGMAKKIIQNAQQRLDSQMDNDGRFPLEMARTTSLHYTVFVMNAFFNIAQMAQKSGVDFWNYKSPSGKSLKKGFDELLPYLTKEKEWKGTQIKNFDFEEGFQILSLGYSKLGCIKCRDFIKNIDGEKSPRLLINLIY